MLESCDSKIALGSNENKAFGLNFVASMPKHSTCCFSFALQEICTNHMKPYLFLFMASVTNYTSLFFKLHFGQI